MEKKNILEVTSSGLCMGCGICQDSCPHDCITIKHSDTNKPLLDVSKCVKCGLCYASCPGKGIKLKDFAQRLFPDDKVDTYIGRYVALFTGHSNNHNIRFHSASGGMVTQFLIYLFDKKIIDGAVVVGQQGNNKMLPKPFIARNRQEVISAKSSKYVVTSMEGMAAEILSSPGKYVIVGLPCHVHAFRQLETINKRLRDSIIGHFAIYCSLNKTRNSTEYYQYRYKVDLKIVTDFAYRDDGCMGYMKFTGVDDQILKKVPYVHFWMGTHNFFQNPRCSLCFDQLGELSDISFGDINMPPYNEDKIGINSFVVRDRKWYDILLKAVEEGYLTIADLSENDLIQCQGYVKSYKKGNGIAATLMLRKLMHQRLPYNDEQLPKANFKGIIKSISDTMMRSIGRHRCFWPIIKALDPYND